MREINITYNPKAHPAIEIDASRPSDPKNDILIMCDAIMCMIKLMKDNGTQKDYESMKAVQDRLNAGFMQIDKINAESHTADPTEDQGDDMAKADPRWANNKPSPKPDLMFKIDENDLSYLKFPGIPPPTPEKHRKLLEDDLEGQIIFDLNRVIAKYGGRIKFGHLLGIIENLKIDLWFNHYRHMGVL